MFCLLIVVYPRPRHRVNSHDLHPPYMDEFPSFHCPFRESSLGPLFRFMFDAVHTGGGDRGPCPLCTPGLRDRSVVDVFLVEQQDGRGWVRTFSLLSKSVRVHFRCDTQDQQRCSCLDGVLC